MRGRFLLNVVAFVGLVVPLALAGSPQAHAQAFPSKPILLIVPFPPGGIDTVARLLGSGVGESLGQPVVVENRAGANGMIGSESVAHAAPDGYTLLFATSSTLCSGVLMMKQPPIDSLRDFVPVSLTYGGMQVVAVDSRLPVHTLKELVAYARANPGKLNYSTSGIGSVFHFYAEALQDAAGGINWVHVPYKGTGPSLQALLRREVQVGFPSYQGIRPAVEKGTHRILAVVVEKRVPLIPDVPTVNEIYPSFQKPASWIGVFGPSHIPTPVLERLSTAFVQAAHSPKVIAYMKAGGNELIASTYKEAAVTVKHDYELTAQAMKRAGIEPQ